MIDEDVTAELVSAQIKKQDVVAELVSAQRNGRT
jgi:hypothetical protein